VINSKKLALLAGPLLSASVAFGSGVSSAKADQLPAAYSINVTFPSAATCDVTPTTPLCDNLFNATQNTENVGFTFTVSAPKWFNKIGAWVRDSSWAGAHNVYLYDITDSSTPEVLVSTIVSSSPQTPCLYQDQFCYTGIQAVQLVTGKTYLAVASYSQLSYLSSEYVGGLSGTDVTFDSSISFGQNRYSESNGQLPPLGTYDFSSYAGPYGNFGPNILFGGEPTPPASSVPAPLPLIGASIAMGYSRKLRTRIKQAKA